MARGERSAEARYARVVDALSAEPAVTVGSSGKGFGSSALKVENRIFAMLSSKGRFVVKLPAARVEALARSGDGKRFDPGRGRVMKEWLELEPASSVSWLALAREALGFVGAGRGSAGRKN
jgi:hypothetical protein